MPVRFRLTALAAFALSLGFFWFFGFTKHDPRVSPLAPFTEDPFDASASFCMIVSLLLALLSLARAFRRHPEESAEFARFYLARTQAALACGILCAIWLDCIAMARHTSQWAGKPASDELLALLAGMAIASAAVLALVRWEISPVARTLTRSALPGAVSWLLIATIVAAVFPESAIRLIAWHLAAIVIGFVLVAAPQAAFAVALVPDCLPAPSEPRRPWHPWLAILLVGIGIGTLALIGELSEGGGDVPLTKRIIFTAVIVGAGTATMVVAYAFLGKPLALFRKPAPPVASRQSV